MNKVIITGRITRDPEARTTQGGISQSTMTVAVDRRFKDKDGNRQTDFLTVVAWRQTADFCNKYLTKGRMIAVEGSIQTRSYTAQDGSKRYVTEIIADSVEAMGDNKPKPDAKPEEPAPDQFTEVEDDDLPF